MTDIYENILESLGEGLISVDTELNITVFNLWAEKLTGTSRDSAIGKPMDEVFALDKWLTDLIKDTIKSSKTYTEFEETLHRKFSGPAKVSVTSRQIYDNDGNLTGALWFMRDITGIKSIKKEALRKDRLAYIGSFATNLAHEVRNPLLGIRGAAQLLGKKVEDEKLKEYSEVIIKEADRLNATVNDMLNFARPRAIQKKQINIHQVIDSVIMISEKDDDTVKIKREYDPSLPDVIGDENQLTQVIMNTVRNATDAAKETSADRPQIIIRTRIVTDFRLKKDDSDAAKFSQIEIEDNGCGIAEEELEKIFTPFFTTKAHGTGLGLPISYRIVKEHDGFLKVDSTLGTGTTVTIMLPTATKK